MNNTHSSKDHHQRTHYQKSSGIVAVTQPNLWNHSNYDIIDVYKQYTIKLPEVLITCLHTEQIKLLWYIKQADKDNGLS